MNPAAPLWSVGFRPFFILTLLSGLILPSTWVLMLTGTLANAGVAWHAHEMFFGFGWALLAGFLLTASKNWLAIRGYHGTALIYLTGAWLLERLTINGGQAWPWWLQVIGLYTFIVSIIGMLLYSLMRYRDQDSFKDNYYFMLALPLFVIAKYALLTPALWLHGTSMCIALFRLTILIMLERTQTPFMQAAFKVNILRNPMLDHSIKLLALLLCAESLLPTTLAGALNGLLAALLLARFVYWHPQKAFTRIDIAVMYIGYVAITLQLALNAWSPWQPMQWIGSVSTHLFTVGALAMLAPAMITRISKGHTGRKVLFDAMDKAVLWLVISAALVRLVLPQIMPTWYLPSLAVVAILWACAYSLLLTRYLPILTQARLDGRTH